MIVVENNRTLSGGIDSRTAGRLIASNEAVDLLNVDISQPGLRVKRLEPLVVATLQLSNEPAVTICQPGYTIPFELDWIGSAGATGYRVEVFRQAGCQPANLRHTSPDLPVGTTHYEVPDIFGGVPEATYSWHVIALGNGSTTVDTASDCCTINVGAIPCTQLPEAVLVSPINDDIPTSNPVTFTWEPVPNAIGYIVRVYVRDNLNPTHISPILPPSQTTYTVALVTGQDYDWTVQAVGDGINFCEGVEGPRAQFEGACSLTIEPANILLGACGGGGIIIVTASGPTCEWTASEAVSWITLTGPVSGIGNGAVTFSVTVNDTGVQRSGTITVGGEGVSVVQNPCTFVVTETSYDLGPCLDAGNQVHVSTEACCPWTAVSNAAWITITAGASGTGEGDVTFTVAQNSTGAERTGTMTIAGETVTVNQEHCGFAILPTFDSAACLGDSGTFAVSAATCCTWTAVSNNSSWLHVTGGATGTGNGTVSWTADMNPGVTFRIGTITAAGQTFTVTQGGGCGVPLACIDGGPYTSTYTVNTTDLVPYMTCGLNFGGGAWNGVLTRIGSNCEWAVADGGQVNGKAIRGAGVILCSGVWSFVVYSGGGSQSVAVSCDPTGNGDYPAFFPVWATKNSGQTPAGTYTVVGGCGAGPGTITIT